MKREVINKVYGLFKKRYILNVFNEEGLEEKIKTKNHGHRSG